MKAILYSVILVLSAVIIYLTYIMQSHPYTNNNLSSVYFMGCNFGSAPLTNEKVNRCIFATSIFEGQIGRL